VGLSAFEGRSSLRTWIFRILVNQARTRATRDARDLPFSAVEGDDGPTVDPAAFGADGRWASSPPRLDSDPETGLLSVELRGRLLEDMRRLVGSLHDVAEPPPDPETREALLRAYRDLRGAS
jgi:RNA polymerase sigma-70 factor (ECF subfamily)